VWVTLPPISSSQPPAHSARRRIQSERLATRTISTPKLGTSTDPTDTTVGIFRITPSASGGTVMRPVPLAASASAARGQATDR